MKNAKFSWHDPQYKSAGTRQSSPIPLRAYLDTATSRGQKEHGAGTPRELAAGTAALRSAGVLACEFWQRPAASWVPVSRACCSDEFPFGTERGCGEGP